jgi:hypothetical protein
MKTRINTHLSVYNESARGNKLMQPPITFARTELPRWAFNPTERIQTVTTFSSWFLSKRSRDKNHGAYAAL